MQEVKYRGELNLAGMIIPCYVLEDGTRLLSGSKVQEALKISSEGQRAGTKIDKFFNQRALRPIVSQYLSEETLTPVVCYNGDKKIYCYHAEALADICDCVLEARRHNNNIGTKLKIVAYQCEILMRAFARVGITALIDEATGYQVDRGDAELQRILAAYISDEVAKWQLTFSSEFYKELYRVYNIPEPVGRKKPLKVGFLTNQLIYKQLPNGVLEALKEKTGKTENGNWKHCLHQSLTPDVGRQHLRNQILEVTTLMAVSENKDQFKQLFNRRFQA